MGLGGGGGMGCIDATLTRLTTCMIWFSLVPRLLVGGGPGYEAKFGYKHKCLQTDC